MSRTDSNRSMRRALPSLALVSLALAACGSSSSNTGTSSAARTSASVAHGAPASTASTTATASTVATAPTSASKSKTGGEASGKGSVIAALRECAKAKGTKKCVLPAGPTLHIHPDLQGQTPTGAPSKGAATTQIKSPPVPAPAPEISGSQTDATPGGKAAFDKYAACLRANGVSVPGAGGTVNMSTPEAKAAEAKCLGYLGGGA